MRETAKDFAKEFSSYVNGGSMQTIRETVELCLNDHPTLQQTMMRFCVEFIEQMAAKNYGDLRNEASRKFAKAVIARDIKRALPLI